MDERVTTQATTQNRVLTAVLATLWMALWKCAQYAVATSGSSEAGITLDN
jgi:hypothetical protein